MSNDVQKCTRCNTYHMGGPCSPVDLPVCKDCGKPAPATAGLRTSACCKCVKRAPANPPSVPSLDVEACVRLLTEDLDSLLDAAAEFAVRNRIAVDAPNVLNYQGADLSRERLGDLKRRYNARLSALASALPGMGKLREVVHGWTGMDTAEEVDEWFVNNKADQLIAAHALSAARAAHPEETSADA